jgi:NAD(P)-dependent dehydrogenase (short-subunit alcohol dehydrogenase family)
MKSTAIKIALVTGAGTGIGRAASLALSSQGFAVVLAGRRPEPLDAVAREIANLGATALAVPTDLRRPDSVAQLFARVRDHFGRLDVLFNNAGALARAVPMEELSLEEWQSVVDVNLTGAFLCTQQAIMIMKSQDPRGGRIINNGSISAHVPRPYSVPYTATKHAISGLTKSTALDGRQYDIACGQIDIGNAPTDIRARDQRGHLQPNGTRLVEPTMDLDSVARAVAYMASLPLDANVLSMTVMATKMPYVGRG